MNIAQSTSPCPNCDCKEFVCNPWKADKCINCYHYHDPARKKTADETSMLRPMFPTVRKNQVEDDITKSTGYEYGSLKSSSSTELTDSDSSEKSSSPHSQVSNGNSTSQPSPSPFATRRETLTHKESENKIPQRHQTLTPNARRGKPTKYFMANPQQKQTTTSKIQLDRKQYRTRVVTELRDTEKIYTGKLATLIAAPLLKPVYTGYSEKYTQCQAILKECEKNAAFSEWIEETIKEKANGESIRSFLILPIQRIPRYILLLQDLLKHTETAHPDYEQLVTAVDKIKGVANDINSEMKRQENIAKIVTINQSMINYPKTLVAPHRLYIRDGPLMKVCRKTDKVRWVFLFNDILVYADPLQVGGIITANKYIFHQEFPLSTLRLDDIPDGEKFSFQIASSSKSFKVYAQSHDEKYEWMVEIIDAINNWKSRQAPTGDKVYEAPVWQPDKESPNCNLCSEEFTIIKRRHHCRACGACVCGDCSQHKISLPNFPNAKVRVCSKCKTQFS